MKPRPVPTDLREAAIKTIRAAKFPMLASIDGDQARVRPVSPVRTEGFTVYVASMRSSHKTGEIELHPQVELCYLDEEHDQVRITGTAFAVTDRALIESIWSGNPLLRAYLGSLENPEFMLYRIEPRRVRFMREWALEYHEVPLA
jgi:general stress protein 26